MPHEIIVRPVRRLYNLDGTTGAFGVYEMQPGIARFDLTDLRLFLMIIEHGSITKGAEAMSLALASASERISGMEAALGAPLFERTSRGVRATAAGDALARHARLITNQVEEMRGDLRRFATGLKGRVRL